MNTTHAAKTLDPGPGTLSVIHVGGHYAEGGWLIGNGCPEWREPVTDVEVDNDNTVRITGDDFDTKVSWLEHDRVVDDLTGVAPTIGHYDTVAHWILSLNESADVASLLQHAGLFPDDTFTDDRDLSDDGDERRDYGD